MTTDQPDTVGITTSRNGPYMVTGQITITDYDNTSVPVPPATAVALCRCGQSNNKPFCDGAHTAAGFDGTINHSAQ